MNGRDALTPEERALAALLEGPPDDPPSPAVDAAILAAARAAITPVPAAVAIAANRPSPRPRRQRPRGAHWPAIAGLAASVVFAVGLAWQLRPSAPSMPPAPARADAPATPTVAAATEAPSPRIAPVLPPSPAVPASASVPASTTPVPSSAVRTPRSAVAGRAAGQAPSAPVRSQAAETHTQTFLRADIAEVAEVAPLPTPGESAPAPAARTARSSPPPAHGASPVTRHAARGTPVHRELQADARDDVRDDARLPRRQWLQKIRARRDAGDVAAARASLVLYLRHYPRTRPPRDLLPLLAD